MKIGSVKEIKKFEYRVGLTPDNVRSYVNAGHQVYIERNAGVGSGFMTDDYIKAGATILETAREVWETAEMIVKVKEPLPDEYQYFRKGTLMVAGSHGYVAIQAGVQLIIHKKQIVLVNNKDSEYLVCY